MYNRPPREGCPVNDLPMELLAYIFCLGTGDPDSLLPVPFPVLASHVCRFWRSVALGSPSLWTTITFSEDPPYERSKIWTERSKSLPIDITFEVNFSEQDPDGDNILALLSHVATILDIIVPHVTRWRKLKVFVNMDVFVEHVLARLAQCDSAPLLEILVLRHFNSDGFRSGSSSVPFHGNTPRLSYVTLEDVSIGWSSSLLHDLVELKLLNHVMNVRPRWVDFSRILRASPRLTNLQLFYSGPAEPLMDWQDDPIELPSLEKISLTNYDPIYVSSLFRLLSMPNLKELSLDLHGGDFSEFVRQLATPPRSVLSGLQDLRIDDLSCDSSTIKLVYEQLTNLKSIHLNCELIHKSFFTMLMEPFSGALYCPNLTTIITEGILGEEMVSFIAVRAMAGIPIKQIIMGRDYDPSEEAERWLRENVQYFEHF